MQRQARLVLGPARATMAPVAMQRLTTALKAWEHHHAALDAASREVAAALVAVRQHVRTASTELSRCRKEVALEMHERRDEVVAVHEGGGDTAAPAAAAPAVGGTAGVGAALQTVLTSAEDELQAAAQARVEAARCVRAAVERVQAHAKATPLVEDEALAAAREAHNQERSALLWLMGSAHLDGQTGAYILRSLSVVALWRLRRVSRSFRRWGTEVLAALPRPLMDSTSGIMALDLASLQWSSDIAVPPLPVRGGRLVVVGGGPGLYNVAAEKALHAVAVEQQQLGGSAEHEHNTK
eukprot:COSAG01_NODE_10956_length_2039_cov_5.647423_1_plen_296_part_00